MNKIVMFILILTISVLIFGCNKDSNVVFGEIDELIEASDDFNFDSGTLEIDGDTTTLEFEREEVANGIFMEKKVEFVETDDGYDGTITITFDGEGDYAHIETIPKSFAAHVDDLKFSVEPDEIIEEDPIVKWEITKSHEILHQITIQAGVKAAAADPISVAMLAVSSSVVFSDDAQSAALGSILSSANDFAFVKGLQKCEKFSGDDDIKQIRKYESCILGLLIKWPEKFTKKDCNDIKIYNVIVKGLCDAITYIDYNKCKVNTKLGMEANVESELDCKKLLVTTYMNKCKNEDDACKIVAATLANYPDLCETLNSPFNKVCLAMVYQNDIYCQEISDSTVRTTCCSTLNTNQNDIDDCALDDEEPQALEEDLPPLPEWMDCPVPKGTKLREWNQKQTSGYEYLAEGNMKNYGPYVKYWGKDYVIPYKFYCYDEDGEKHGKFKEYQQKTSLLQIEGAYYHGKYDGIVKEYSGEHLIKLTTYEKGRKNGYAEEYISNGENIGTIKKKGYYVDGSRDGEWESYDEEGERIGTIIYTGPTSDFIPI